VFLARSNSAIILYTPLTSISTTSPLNSHLRKVLPTLERRSVEEVTPKVYLKEGGGTDAVEVVE